MQNNLIITAIMGAFLCCFLGCDGLGASSGNRLITAKCYFSLEDEGTLAATVTDTVAIVDQKETIYIRLAMDPQFVDNTYGANAVGWENSKKGGHEFKELVGSDHEELKLYDKAGDLKAHFKMDYLSQNEGNDGYSSMGVTGGDGEIFVGDPSEIIAFTTAMDRNLNEHPYSQYTVDSPATDTSYKVNTDAPEWEYLVIYEIWVDAALFAENGFGEAVVEYIHASPSKGLNNTIEVVEGDCPDSSWDDGNEVINDEGDDPEDESQGPQPPVV